VVGPYARTASGPTAELRYSFICLLSDSGVHLEDIAGLCGHVLLP
jgi:hypothetical protein